MNPYAIQPNAPEPTCDLCGAGPDVPCDRNCPEANRCRECHELSGDCAADCTEAAIAREERAQERADELTAELFNIAGGF